MNQNLNTIPEQEQSIDVIKIFIECLHRWWWFVIAVFVCLAVAFVYLKRQTSQYTVAGSIMIRSDQNSGPMFQSEMLDLMGYSGYKSVMDEVEILSSYTIMEQVVRALNLQTNYRKKDGLRWVGQYPTPDIAVTYPAGYLDTLTAGVGISIQRKDDSYEIKVSCRKQESEHTLTSLAEPVQTCAGLITFMEIHPLEPGDKMAISTYPVPAITDYYRALAVCEAKDAKMERSNIITISCTSDLPRRDIDVITKMVELYNLDAVIDKNIMATNTAAFINDRLNIITLELDTVERAVEAYMKENGLTDIDKELQLALTTKEAYQRQQTDLELQINLLNYIQEYLSDPKNEHSLIPGNLGINDPSLVQIMRDYNTLLLSRLKITRSATEDNPKLAQVDDQLVQMRAGIISSIKNNKEGLIISRNDLSRKDEQYNRIIRQVPAKERRYMEIKRQQEIKEKLFIYLYEKREENALTLASSVMPAKVVDKPRSSSRPVAPRKSMILLVAFALGISIPLAIIFLLDYFNNEIKDRKEFQNVVKAPFLGEVIVDKEGKNIVVNRESNTVSAEMFRTIRTNMKFMLPDKPCPVILVTSALNGEGKSFVALNTAISLALLGKRVILVGLDIRKPVLADYVGLSFRGQLTSYLMDSSIAVDDLIRPSGVVDGLDIAPSGVVPPNPAELIQSPRLKTLFDELRTRYDLIILDTAPVTLVADTFHLAPLADMTLFVTRANYTSREMLPFIQEIYEDRRLPNMACVLNGIDASKAYGHYGYGHTYGYGHYGYGSYTKKS
ncbi:MAG: polysaccharide biosynthesis tyrosine autokinase [Paludibacteraceae bacterium]|nr:polysaccharide biosynthesis tyrosine autokinase [Paludibacteraceae bacterium]